MKWHSIKTHRPPADGYCLVRTEHGAFYCAEWRGGSDDKHADASHGWMIDTLCEESDCEQHKEIYGVTHFCIPDAVEIS